MPVLMMELRVGLSGPSRMAKVGTPGASTVTGLFYCHDYCY